jgi:hypothetical protein
MAQRHESSRRGAIRQGFDQFSEATLGFATAFNALLDRPPTADVQYAARDFSIGQGNLVLSVIFPTRHFTGVGCNCQHFGNPPEMNQAVPIIHLISTK